MEPLQELQDKVDGLLNQRADLSGQIATLADSLLNSLKVQHRARQGHRIREGEHEGDRT